MSDKKVNELQKKIMKDIDKLNVQVTRNIDVIEHAKIVRKELKLKFPKIKFKVKSARFSGGDSVTIYHCDVDLTREKEREIQDFVNTFDGFESDLMDGRYNVGFEYKGERLRGASFCQYNHKWSGR